MSIERVACNKMIVILGPTAVGKTKLAVHLASRLNGEVISADSRQVYRNMNIGTGKDLEEYSIQGSEIPYHLIDILDAGEAYDLYSFQQDFYQAYESILKRNKCPILCGGTGLYLDAALSKKQMIEVSEDKLLREELKDHSQEKLNEILFQLNPKPHNQTDTLERDRTIRAIEIEKAKQSTEEIDSPVKDYLVFGIRLEREVVRQRIEIRLRDRLKNGMIEEVEQLIKQGVSYERLNYYGLEYKFIGQYLSGDLSYEDMFRLLLQAIHRFAKKQMTWFRRMEKQGIRIHWIDGLLPLEEKLQFIKSKLA